MNKSAIGRLGGLALAVVACVLFNLNGCSRHYIDSTQRHWLINFQQHSTVPVSAGSVQGAPQLFSGEVSTQLSGRLQAPRLGELSGLAVSRHDGDLYWAINDSGNRPELFALNRAGVSLGKVRLPFSNYDWEALAAFEDGGKRWLLIADTGDNLRRRETHSIYIIEEPDLQGDRNIRLHRRIDFTYEDGPQNIESVAVSVAERAIYLVSKNAVSPTLYALPLDLARTGSGTAVNANTSSRPIAKVVGQMQPLPFTEDDRFIEQVLAGRFLLGPTSMDINAAETLAVVANYRHAYLYRRAPEQSWPQAFMQKPAVITSHRLAQSESVAFGLDDNTLLVGSEGMHSPLLLVEGDSP
jgi:hypothetical protein